MLTNSQDTQGSEQAHEKWPTAFKSFHHYVCMFPSEISCRVSVHNSKPNTIITIVIMVTSAHIKTIGNMPHCFATHGPFEICIARYPSDRQPETCPTLDPLRQRWPPLRGNARKWKTMENKRWTCKNLAFGIWLGGGDTFLVWPSFGTSLGRILY